MSLWRVLYCKLFPFTAENPVPTNPPPHTHTHVTPFFLIFFSWPSESSSHSVEVSDERAVLKYSVQTKPKTLATTQRSTLFPCFEI